jgi:hypothetical protein
MDDNPRKLYLARTLVMGNCDSILLEFKSALNLSAQRQS